MRKEFVFNLGQTGGEFFVTATATKDGPSPAFFFVKRTRQQAIEAACQGIATWLRSNRANPKDQFKIERVQKYERPISEATGKPKQKKFGGLPMKQMIPNEVITVSVEV